MLFLNEFFDGSNKCKFISYIFISTTLGIEKGCLPANPINKKVRPLATFLIVSDPTSKTHTTSAASDAKLNISPSNTIAATACR